MTFCGFEFCALCAPHSGYFCCVFFGGTTYSRSVRRWVVAAALMHAATALQVSVTKISGLAVGRRHKVSIIEYGVEELGSAQVCAVEIRLGEST